jgi:hypothetical protein
VLVVWQCETTTGKLSTLLAKLFRFLRRSDRKVNP